MNRRGFTMLEVLVATAIFMMMAAVIAGAYVNVQRAYQGLANDGVLDAHWAAAKAQFLAEVDRKKAEEGGEVKEGDARLRWSVEILPTDVPALYRCRWRGELQSPGQNQNVVRREEFLLYRAEWSQPQEQGVIEERFRARLQERLPEPLVRGGVR